MDRCQRLNPLPLSTYSRKLNEAIEIVCYVNRHRYVIRIGYPVSTPILCP